METHRLQSQLFQKNLDSQSPPEKILLIRVSLTPNRLPSVTETNYF